MLSYKKMIVSRTSATFTYGDGVLDIRFRCCISVMRYTEEYILPRRRHKEIIDGKTLQLNAACCCGSL